MEENNKDKDISSNKNEESSHVDIDMTAIIDSDEEDASRTTSGFGQSFNDFRTPCHQSTRKKY